MFQEFSFFLRWHGGSVDLVRENLKHLTCSPVTEHLTVSLVHLVSMVATYRHFSSLELLDAEFATRPAEQNLHGGVQSVPTNQRTVSSALKRHRYDVCMCVPRCFGLIGRLFPHIAQDSMTLPNTAGHVTVSSNTEARWPITKAPNTLLVSNLPTFMENSELSVTDLQSDQHKCILTRRLQPTVLFITGT